jgi:hypothetical protein
MTLEDVRDAECCCWAALVARVLHPIDVQTIEAMRWIGLSLSAGDLIEVFDGKPSLAVIGRHLRRLVKLDAVEIDEAPTPAHVAGITYRLSRRRQSDER